MCSLTSALDARVDWAHHRIATVAKNSDAAIEYLQEALQSAFWSGCQSYEQNVPLSNLLADVPLLATSWRSGRNHQRLSEEMNACPGCNDGSGNPCPTHG